MKFLYVLPILFTVCACDDNTKVVANNKVELSDIAKINQCIDQIETLTYLQKKYDNKSDTVNYEIVIPGYGALSYEQAMRISENWNYNDLKLYTHQDNVLQKHEHDACTVLKRLNTFIEENDIPDKIERW